MGAWLLLFQSPRVTNLIDPLLDVGIVPEVVIHAGDVFQKAEDRSEAVKFLEERSEQVPSISMSKPVGVDPAVRLAGRAGYLHAGAIALMPVLPVSNVTCDTLGTCPEGQVGLDGVHTEGIDVLEMDGTQAKGLSCLSKTCNAATCTLS